MKGKSPPSPFLEEAQKQIPGNCRVAIFIPDSNNHEFKDNSQSTLIQISNILIIKRKPSLSFLLLLSSHLMSQEANTLTHSFLPVLQAP